MRQSKYSIPKHPINPVITTSTTKGPIDLKMAEPKLWMVAVHTDKGGAGKTTLVVNLADAWSRILKDFNILVIDADPQCNSSCRLLGRDRKVKGEANGWVRAFSRTMEINNAPEAQLPQKKFKDLPYRARTIGGWLQLTARDKTDSVEAASFVTHVAPLNDTFQKNVYLVCGDTRLHRQCMDTFSGMLLHKDPNVRCDALTCFRTLATNWQMGLPAEQRRPTIVLIDTNASFSCFTRCAVASSDFVLLPYKPEMDAGHGVLMCLETIFGEKGNIEGSVKEQCEALDIRCPKVLGVVLNEAVQCSAKDQSHKIRREMCIQMTKDLMQRQLAEFREAFPDAFIECCEDPHFLLPNYGIRATVSSFQQCPVSGLSRPDIIEEVRVGRWASIKAQTGGERKHERELERFLSQLTAMCRQKKDAKSKQFVWKNPDEFELNKPFREFCRVYGFNVPMSVRKTVATLAIEVCKREGLELSSGQVYNKFKDQYTKNKGKPLARGDQGNDEEAEEQAAEEEDCPAAAASTFACQANADYAATEEIARELLRLMGVEPSAPSAGTANRLVYDGTMFRVHDRAQPFLDCLPEYCRQQLNELLEQAAPDTRAAILSWLDDPPRGLSRASLSKDALIALRGKFAPIVCIFPYANRGTLATPEKRPEDDWEPYDAIVLRCGKLFKLLDPEAGCVKHEEPSQTLQPSAPSLGQRPSLPVERPKKECLEPPKGKDPISHRDSQAPVAASAAAVVAVQSVSAAVSPQALPNRLRDISRPFVKPSPPRRESLQTVARASTEASSKKYSCGHLKPVDLPAPHASQERPKRTLRDANPDAVLEELPDQPPFRIPKYGLYPEAKRQRQ